MGLSRSSVDSMPSVAKSIACASVLSNSCLSPPRRGAAHLASTLSLVGRDEATVLVHLALRRRARREGAAAARARCAGHAWQPVEEGERQVRPCHRSRVRREKGAERARLGGRAMVTDRKGGIRHRLCRVCKTICSRLDQRRTVLQRDRQLPWPWCHTAACSPKDVVPERRRDAKAEVRLLVLQGKSA